MIRRPPRSTLFPSRRSSDLVGIEAFRMMPAVGDSPLFIAALKDLVLRAVGMEEGAAAVPAGQMAGPFSAKIGWKKFHHRRQQETKGGNDPGIDGAFAQKRCSCAIILR